MKYQTYTKYKPSGVEWIGDIPDDWSEEKLKSYFKFKKGKNSQKYNKEYIGDEKNFGNYPPY